MFKKLSFNSNRFKYFHSRHTLVVEKILDLVSCSCSFIFFFFQGQLVNQNVSWGVIISTRSLVLQRVARYHAGNYGCAAANDRGENQSAFVNLRIHCKCYILRAFFFDCLSFPLVMLCYTMYKLRLYLVLNKNIFFLFDEFQRIMFKKSL